MMPRAWGACLDFATRFWESNQRENKTIKKTLRRFSAATPSDANVGAEGTEKLFPSNGLGVNLFAEA
jgi:hypothetical protein